MYVPRVKGKGYRDVYVPLPLLRKPSVRNSLALRGLHCRLVNTIFLPTDPHLVHHSLHRALLVLGRDAGCSAAVTAEAARNAFAEPGHEAKRWRYLATTAALTGTVHHARGEFDNAQAAFDTVLVRARYGMHRRVGHRSAYEEVGERKC